MKPIAFGLTGGIASGKSTVAKTFKSEGIPVVDADLLARAVVRPGSPALEKIVGIFGEEILTPQGEMDRGKVGSMVFGNPVKLRLLDMAIGPFLRAVCHYEVERLFDQGHRLVCFDAPILIEKNLQEMYRPVVVVHCSVETQIKRMLTRNGFTEEEARQRLAVQLSREERLKHADFDIHTDNTMEETQALAREVLRKVRAWVKRQA